MANGSITLLFLLLAVNVAAIIIASRRTNRFRSAAPPASRFNLIIAMVTTFFVGIVVGTQWSAELKSFTETWGIHTMLVIGTISLLPGMLRRGKCPGTTVDSVAKGEGRFV